MEKEENQHKNGEGKKRQNVANFVHETTTGYTSESGIEVGESTAAVTDDSVDSVASPVNSMDAPDNYVASVSYYDSFDSFDPDDSFDSVDPDLDYPAVDSGASTKVTPNTVLPSSNILQTFFEAQIKSKPRPQLSSKVSTLSTASPRSTVPSQTTDLPLSEEPYYYDRFIKQTTTDLSFDQGECGSFIIRDYSPGIHNNNNNNEFIFQVISG